MSMWATAGSGDAEVLVDGFGHGEISVDRHTGDQARFRIIVGDRAGSTFAPDLELDRSALFKLYSDIAIALTAGIPKCDSQCYKLRPHILKADEHHPACAVSRSQALNGEG